MLKRRSPGVDPDIEPRNGVTRDGQPLSYNRAPALDLAPWIARLYVTVVDAPPDHRLECGLFNDTAFIRIQVKGAWTAQTARGPLAFERQILFFGPHSRRMPVSVTGSFISIGISLRPGASHALKGLSLPENLDAIVKTNDLDRSGRSIFDQFDPQASPEQWLQVMEDMFRERVERTGAKAPDPLTVRFETLAFTDPAASIAEFARLCGVEQRKLERVVRRDFGMAPKQVLRRARLLDMASHLRGVADTDEAEELILRFYDQSHLIHEFTELFGMSPKQFVETPQPLMTLTLESRQARRLELLKRLKPGARRPWEMAEINRKAS